MLIFDQLRVSDDGKRLYINAHVNNASYFEDIYIDSVVIMTADKVSETTPDLPTSEYVYKQDITSITKDLDLVLTINDFNLYQTKHPEATPFTKSNMSDTLWFVYVKCKLSQGGTIDICTPCRLDEETTLGVTFDESILYQRVMDYTKEVVDNCTIPVGFIDFILLWDAFKASVETEHYIAAIKFYNMLFEDTEHKQIIKGCGCNG